MSDQPTPTASARFGYFISIMINAAIYYVINTFPIWDYIPLLNEKYQDVLWITNLSIAVTIFMFATFMVFNPRWYRSLMQAVANVFAFISIRVFRLVFPLDLSDSAAHWANIGLLVLMGIMILSTITELVAAINQYRKTQQI